MIAPLAPYAIRGVIWYQGEANGGDGLEYRRLFPRLIADWRGLWGDQFPFLFVQLPGFESEAMKRQPEPAWAWLREAQMLSLRVPRTAMAVAIDVGDPLDVHPPAKCEIGERLALAARRVAYADDVVASGPLYRDAEFVDGAVRVSFSETGGGLAIGRAPWLPAHLAPLPQDRLMGFALAGEDRVWVEAEARIEGDKVVVSSPKVPKPVAVRYGWANAPRCNLANSDGLPASPFRSDDWPSVAVTR
jgi:sialate O-acetylesterase